MTRIANQAKIAMRRVWACIRAFSPTVGPTRPATEFAFHKGDEFAEDLTEETVLGTAWSHDGKTKLLTSTKILHVQASRRYEVYLIGSKKKNYKQAIFSRPYFIET